jgi:hypothetical protein
MINKKSNLDYNVKEQKNCFNSRNHINFTDTARQITKQDEIDAKDALDRLIKKTRKALQ